MGNSCASKKVPDVELQVDGNTASCFDRIKCKSSCCVVVETSQNTQTVVSSENVGFGVSGSLGSSQSKKKLSKKKK